MSIYTAPATSATIVDGSIVDADVNASAAIAGTKISPNFGSQNVVTTGTSTAASLIPTGSSVPTNGMYLPSANNLSFSTSSTQRMLVDSSGRLLVGASTARTGDGVTPRYFQEGASAYEAIGVCSNGGTTANSGAFLFLSRSRGTTNGSSTIVANGDTIGAINFYGADGTDIDTAAAYISCAVDGTPGLNDMPGRLVFSTTADGAATPTERMRIKNNGTINFSNVATYADNAAATAGGLAVGDVYRTSTGQLMIRY